MARVKYDLNLNGKKVPKLVMRRALLRTVQFLLLNGADPFAINKREYALWGTKKILYSVAGEVRSEEFIRLANIEFGKTGRKFAKIRYFCGDEELVPLNGRTYAICNQWSEEAFLEAMSDFKHDYVDLNIEFSPTSENKFARLGTEKNVAVEEIRQTEKNGQTKYDLNLNGQIFSAFPMNRAILSTVRYLFENGVNPRGFTDINKGLPLPLVIGVDGRVNGAEFQRLAKIEREKNNRKFDSTRFFCQDGEILYFNGRSYAVNTQWGKENFLRVMSRFKNDYTDFNIEFSPTIERKTVNLKSDGIKLGGVSKFAPKKDNTKYDIELNGFSLISLAKNRAVFYFVRYLLENGVNPSEFTERDFELWYNKKLIIGVRGTVNSEEFIRLARAEHIKMRESFDPTRYYCRDKKSL